MIYSWHLAGCGESFKGGAMICPACQCQTEEKTCPNCKHKTDKQVGDRDCDCRRCKDSRSIGPVPLLVDGGNDTATFCYSGQVGPGSAHLCVG